MITYLSRLTSERDSLTEAATELASKAAAEERDLTSTEADSLRAWQTRCAEIDAQLTEYNAQAESARAYARLRDAVSVDEPATPTRVQVREAPKTWGELFVESDVFTEYPGAGTSRRLTLPFELEERAAIGIGTMPAGSIPPFTYSPAALTLASPLLNAVGKVTTSSNAVQWLTWTPDPAAPAAIVPEGELKPEASMVPTIASDSLDTIAHHKGITRQALEDIPQIRSIVEGRLRQGILVKLEQEIAAALVAATLPTASGATLLEAIRVGVGTVQAAGYASPNAVLLNPADWAALDVATIGNAGGASGQSSFWGVRPIASPTQPAGTATVGDFTEGVVLFSRGTIDVFMTDSHADYFVRNILLLLAEVRALATVPVPAALCECTAVTTP